MSAYEEFMKLTCTIAMPIFKKPHEERTEEEKRLIEIFISNHADIIKTVDAIKLSQRLALSAPPRLRGLDELVYLRYHIEHFMHESYMLRERLVRYYKEIAKNFTHQQNREFRGKNAPMTKYLEECFKALCEPRDAHVHETRYDDDSLLNTTVHQIAHTHKIISNEDYNEALESTKKLWKLDSDHNISTIEKILEEYFRVILKLIKKNEIISKRLR